MNRIIVLRWDLCRLKELWNGSDLHIEERINDIEGELEELGG